MAEGIVDFGSSQLIQGVSKLEISGDKGGDKSRPRDLLNRFIDHC